MEKKLVLKCRSRSLTVYKLHESVAFEITVLRILLNIVWAKRSPSVEITTSTQQSWFNFIRFSWSVINAW